MIARFLFTAAHALFWAARDARDIRNGKDINHGVRWTIRAAIEVGATLAVMPFGWGAVMTTLAAAFLFSALFRFLLNTMRGRHWAYVSPSSWYDWQFIRRYLTWDILFGSIESAAEHHNANYRHTNTYPKDIHRAGTLAYIFEAAVFALLVWIA